MSDYRSTITSLLIAVSTVSIGGACSSQQVKDSDQPTEKASTSSESGADEESSSKASSGWDGHQRLGEEVVPQRYRVDLLIDPTNSTFRGDVTVEVDVEKPVQAIRMHAENLEFSTVEASRDGESVAVTPASVDNGGLVLRLEETLSEGPLRIRFQYRGPLDDVPEGLYRVQDKGDWYAYTQFQPLEAREAFPSFDEPRFKTPYDVSVTVPKEMMAASNAPELRSHAYGSDRGKDAGPEPDFGKESGALDGFRTYEFAETKPLPTYLVAFAVGDFDVVESEEVLDEGERLADVRVRVLTTKGNGELARYALKHTPGLVRAQESYFGSKFPYEKMDMVAVPNFSAGAMENVGLVTYRESILLLDEERASVQDEYVAQAVMAHENAHMWFGNSVTLSWWDDLWLNEAFATWMGNKTVQEVSPELEPEVEAVQRRSGVIKSDSMKKSRAVRQPIEDAGDVYNAFDRITYKKGASILRMFEAWIGSKTFRKGVRDYLDAHEHGVAETRDLLVALAEASGKPVREVISGFLDQPGAPLVTVRYDRSSCTKEGRARLQLKQTRYLPVGSEASTGEPWKIPVCLRYGNGKGASGRKCVLFDGSEQSPREQSVTLETDGCPEWIHPNAGEKGYYHWRVQPAERQQRLVEARESLTLPERVALLGHLEAQVRAETLPVDQYVAAMRTMSGAEHRLVVEHIVDALHEFEEVVYRGEPSSAFETFAAELIRPQYERVGFEPSEDDPAGVSLLRPDLVEVLANVAGAEDVRQRAVQVTRKFLDDPDAVATQMAKYSLPIAVRYGEPAIWKKVRDSIESAPTPELRSTYIGALGHTTESEYIDKTLALFFTDTVRAQNFWRLVGSVSGDPRTADQAWTWMTDHYDGIVDKVGEAHAGWLPWVGGSYCSAEGKEKVQAFFSTKEHQTVGTERNLAQAVESIEQCMAYRDLVGDALRKAVE